MGMCTPLRACVRLHMPVYVFMRVCTSLCACVRLYVHVYVSCTYVRLYVPEYVFIWPYTYLRACARYICACVRLYMHLYCVCVCEFVYALLYVRIRCKHVYLYVRVFWSLYVQLWICVNGRSTSTSALGKHMFSVPHPRVLKYICVLIYIYLCLFTGLCKSLVTFRFVNFKHLQ